MFDFIDLPLHDGHVPPWLFNRMVKLSRLIIEIMINEFGIEETIRKFSNPVFFQSFNNLIGMDWDSSGSTTITTAVLREALKDVDLGIKVVGGKGKMALKIPEELEKLSKKFNIDVNYLKNISKLVAKVDNVALQDGYQLYHQAIIIGEDGTWTIIQQGMNVCKRLARRYHWFKNTTFINNPHSGITGIKEDFVINLVSSHSENARKTILDIVNQGSLKLIRDFNYLKRIVKGIDSKSKTITQYIGISDRNIEILNKINEKFKELLKKLNLSDEFLKHIRYFNDFKELLLTPGLGPNTMLALTLIAQLIYSTDFDWEDPVTFDPRRFTFAVGGKDGSPYPVNKEVYDSILTILNSLIDYIRKTKDTSLLKYLRYLAKLSKELELPVDLVHPTP